jgi:hypothetical protein
MPFGLWNRKVQATVDRQRQVDVGYAVRRLGQGDLTLFAGNVGMDIALTLRNISLMEPRASHKAVEGGIRGRIARGLYFYVPQQAAAPEQELAEVDRGTITITVEGLVFAGKSRHIGVGFGAVESMGHTQNGMTIVAKNGSVKLHFEGADRVIIPLKVQDRSYSQPLSGKMMRLLVEAVIKISLEGTR